MFLVLRLITVLLRSPDCTRERAMKKEKKRKKIEQNEYRHALSESFLAV